jgi:hypothetical protein
MIFLDCFIQSQQSRKATSNKQGRLSPNSLLNYNQLYPSIRSRLIVILCAITFGPRDPPIVRPDLGAG